MDRCRSRCSPGGGCCRYRGFCEPAAEAAPAFRPRSSGPAPQRCEELCKTSGNITEETSRNGSISVITHTDAVHAGTPADHLLVGRCSRCLMSPNRRNNICSRLSSHSPEYLIYSGISPVNHCVYRFSKNLLISSNSV